jgi:hypothetical protein
MRAPATQPASLARPHLAFLNESLTMDVEYHDNLSLEERRDPTSWQADSWHWPTCSDCAS